MANFTLSANQEKFPVGTTVGVYGREAFPGGSSAPIGAPITTAVVAANGTTTFTGLADDTSYFAAALVSGTWRRMAFRTASLGRLPGLPDLTFADGETPMWDVDTEKWTKGSLSSAVNQDIVDAKGDLIVGTAADAVSRVSVGANDQVMMADSAAASGVKWSGALAPVINVKAAHGAKGDGVTDDTAAIQAAFNAVSATGGTVGNRPIVFFPEGVYLISSQITAQRDCTIIGSGAAARTVIRAKTGSTWPAGNDTAMLKSAEAFTFDTGGASRRFDLRDIRFDGNNVANVNGILASPQQPASWHNVYVLNCPGYAVALVDTQQMCLYNLTIFNCGTGLRLNSAEMIYVYGCAIEGSSSQLPAHGRHIYITNQVGGIISSNICFYGLHLEVNDDASIPYVETDGWIRALVFDGVWATVNAPGTLFKFGGEVTYLLRGVQMSGTPSGVTAVNDAQRGFTLDARTYFEDYIEEFAGSHVPGSTNLPVALEKRGLNGKTTKIGVNKPGINLETHPGTDAAGSSWGDQIRTRHPAGANGFRVDYGGRPTLPHYTVATLPAAASLFEGQVVYVSDAAAGAKFQGCTGTAWVALG